MATGYEGQHLVERLIEGLLVLAESDRGLPGTEPVRLDLLVGDVLDRFAEQAAEHGVTLRGTLVERSAPGDPVPLDRQSVARPAPCRWAGAAARNISRMTTLPSASVLVRTWFGDDSAWESLVLEVRTPSDEDFLASVTVVNDPAFEGMDAEALREQQPGGAIVSFLADETTLTSAEHPVLAVWVLPNRDDDRTEHRPFRVAPSALWSVENNINLANMDWEEFTRAVEDDGVFRGF